MPTKMMMFNKGTETKKKHFKSVLDPRWDKELKHARAQALAKNPNEQCIAKYNHVENSWLGNSGFGGFVMFTQEKAHVMSRAEWEGRLEPTNRHYVDLIPVAKLKKAS